jgi:hypothetical protein
MQIVQVAALFLWSCFLEASFEDMVPTSNVDARTTKFYFYELFLVVPFFVNRDASEKILTEDLFLHTRDIVGMYIG